MNWIKCSERMPVSGEAVIIPTNFRRDGFTVHREFVSGAVYLNLTGSFEFWNPAKNMTYPDVEYWVPFIKPPKDQ